MNVLKFLPLLAVLVACSGETVTNRIIENQSDKNFGMVLYRNGIASDTLDFSAGQSRQFSVSTKDKGTDEAPDCVRQIDSAYFEISGGGIVTKMIQDPENWETETEQVKNFPAEYENSCVFVVRNSDIE